MSEQLNLVPDRQPQRFDRSALGRQKHEAVDPTVDVPRLKSQFDRVIAFFSDGKPHTQYEAAAALDIPQGSVGSQIRNARVVGFSFNKRRRGGERSGTWEYWLADGKR